VTAKRLDALRQIVLSGKVVLIDILEERVEPGPNAIPVTFQ
jgi:hypothetical protein